ncbi:hypothetical protein WJX72_004076 [[Myrmecia] bisecta]|uniref:t-SNARE coiled-coil homology domain-containing protein n=1 Tax=[Myrmecia] bisecta TaxID=41462 RepID=A0AAW1PXP0_9CHLO
MDITSLYWDAVLASGQRQGIGQDKLLKLKSAQILRSLAVRSEFTVAAVELAKNINALSDFVQQHRRDYVQPGRYTEAERDKIEEQVGAFLNTCNQNIGRLQSSISEGGAASPAATNAHVTAHRHGVALMLSERLQAVGSAFDRCRALRYQQLLQLQQRQQKRRKVLQNSIASNPYYALEDGNGRATYAFQSDTAVHMEDMDPEQRQQIELDNQALQEELLSTGQQMTQVESTMREIASLNSMFSTQVMHQSEQIEQLYSQAVEATKYAESGNVQLQKAIKLNSSSRKIVMWLMLLASAMLLFLDWYSS